MTKNLKRLTAMLCVLVLGISCLGIPAFAASDPMVAEIPVTITLNGTLPSEPETFTVQVQGMTAGCPMPEGSTGNTYDYKLIGNSKTVSGKIAIDFGSAALGIYEYTVQQIPGTDPDCFYDSSVYSITVYVLNNESMTGREIRVVISCDDEKPDGIYFENRYADPVEVTISAIKTLNGGVPGSNMFLFQLLDENGKIVRQVRNDKGTVTFDALVFGDPEDIGQHTYTLMEVNENANSIVYDKSEYKVIIDVSKNEDGDYVAKVSYQLKGKAYEGTPTFANKQKVPNSPYTGDNLQILMWGGLMILSAVCLIIVFLMARKKKATEKAFLMAMDQDTDSDLDEE